MSQLTKRCKLCGVHHWEGRLPLSKDALLHNLCQLCYLRNRATYPDRFLNCWRATDSSSAAEIEYYTIDNPMMTLISWNSACCAHLCDLAPTTTAYKV